MLSLTLLIGMFIWSGRAISTANDRSGGYPKFPQSFFVGGNQLIHGFYITPNQKVHQQVDENACGTRSVHFNPKRFAKIIGGNSIDTFCDFD